VAYAKLGTVVAKANADIPVTGLVAVGYIGTVNVWGEVDDTQDPNWQSINTGQGSNWGAITDTQDPSWQNVNIGQGSNWDSITDTQDPNWERIAA